MDRDAAETYELNFGLRPDARRIEDVDVFPPARVLVGGPPCQGFSPLNRQAVGFERRGLWREYLRALHDAASDVFVMENVPQLLKSAEYAAFKKFAEATGFQVEGRILNAADYGVPQHRRRAIVIGTRLGSFDWPEPTHHDPKVLPLRRERAQWLTFRDAVEGLPLEPDGRDWHRGRNPRPESVRRYQAVPPDGGDRFEMQRNLDRVGLQELVPACWRNKPRGTTDVFGRLWWDRPSGTIRTEFYKPEKGRYLHPSEDRPITVREAARCMGFPDSFGLPEHQSMTSVGRQIGNAVPPPLAKAVAGAVAEHLETAIGTPEQHVLAA